MTTTEQDTRLREHSKLLLKQLKEQQSKLEDIVDKLYNESLSVVNSPRSTDFKSILHAENKTLFQTKCASPANGAKVTKKLVATSEKSVTACPGNEGKSRLSRKIINSGEEKENAVIRPEKEEAKNIAKKFTYATMKKIEYKILPDSDGQSESVDAARTRSRELEAEMDNLKKAVEDTEQNADSRTPDIKSRRNIIDRNVKVNNDLNASELMRECENDFHKLNYSYSNTEDSNLVFLPQQLGLKGIDKRKVAVHDTDNAVTGKSFSHNLNTPENIRKVAGKFIRETKKPKSILLSAGKRQNKSAEGHSCRVSFRSPLKEDAINSTCEMNVAAKHQQKMLGYDWIAGLLENDPQTMNQSETFLEELQQFRKLNLHECVNNMYKDGTQELWEHPEKEPSPVRKALEETKVKPYVVNDRLFAESVKRSIFLTDCDNEGSTSSPAKEMDPTYDHPRFLRVSIPRSTLLSPYKVKPHHKSSLDGLDSMALSRTLEEAEKLAANYPYDWNPSEQTISHPVPRLAYFPEAAYGDSIWPSAVRSRTSTFTPSSELQKASDNLQNSTLSLMCDMKKLKMERNEHQFRL